MGPAAREAVPALIETLRDENESAVVRQWAAWSLGQIGPDARGAVPALVEALGDASPNVREAAAEALEKIRGE